MSLRRQILNIIMSSRMSHNLKDETKQSMLALKSSSVMSFRDRLGYDPIGLGKQA